MSATSNPSPEQDEPRGVGRWAKGLATLWGAALFLPTMLLLLGFCCLAASMPVSSSDDADVRAFGLGLVGLLAVGLACGGVMLFQGAAAWRGRPAHPLRLPPLWAIVGGFVVALATGVWLWQIRGLGTLTAPWFVVAAAALPPLAACVWAVEERPGRLTWRRASVAFAAGATVSTLLALILEILVPYAVIDLFLDLSEPLLGALERLVDLVTGGEIADALTSTGFLLAMIELAVVAPLVEEFIKSLATLPLARATASRRDVFLLGAAAGAGFAAFENLLYALFAGRYWAGLLVVRGLGAAVHPLGAGLTALAWHGLLNKSAAPRTGFWKLFGLAVGQHALWNGGLMLWFTLVGALGVVEREADVMGVGVAVGLLALIAVEGAALWMGLRLVSRRLEGGTAASATAGLRISTERAIALWAIVCLLALLPVGLRILQDLWGR